MVEILHNNYQIPVYSVEDQDNIINLIHSKEFNDIYSFYSEQIPRGSRLEQLPDFEKRMGFYLYYTGQEQFLNQLDVLLYKKHMPTIQEFLKDDAYMGNSYAIIYPYWRQILAKIFDPSNQYFECVFRGSIGSGKSTIARRGLIYALYRICCLRSPHKLFNIAPDTVLSALMISVTLQQAQDTALKPVLEMIRNSPCFHEVRKMTAFDSFGPNDPVPFCRQGNGIRFPNNVYLSVGSNINHIIGYSVFGCLTGDTEIVTDRGNVRIDVIAEDCSAYKVKTLEQDGTYSWNTINHCECTKEVNELIEIVLENNKSIKCTTDHKFPIRNKDVGKDKSLILYKLQWCKHAEDITCEDYLECDGNQGIWVDDTKRIKLEEPVKVYNLEVNNKRHNYFLASGVYTCNSVFDEAEEKDSSEAFKLYTGLRERIRSRFLNSSLIYCALISSSKSKSGMVWEYIHKIKPDDPETLLLDPAIWEVKGDALGLSGKHFWIYIGTKTHPSKVLPEEYNDVPLEKLNYVPPAGCELLEVPIEYRREFENNIEAAIQNIAGRTTDTSDRPFDDLSRIGDCKQLLPEVHLEAPLGDQIPLIDKLPKELFQETTLGPRLARYPNAPRFCFSEDTKVKLLSGISKTMKELSDDYKNGVENFVYSWDCNKNKWCVGKIVFAGVTKSVNKLAKVTLDDGSIIKCTPDHKFLLKSGVYKSVSEIDFNESLLAIYKKESKVVSYKRKSYEQILNPITKSWDYTHKISANFYCENREEANNLAHCIGSRVVIHHKDFNATNNNPNNLIFLENEQHLKIHSNSEKNALSELWKLESFRDMMLTVSANNGKVNGKFNMNNNWHNESFVAKMKIVNAENGRKNIVKYNKSELRRNKISQLCKDGKIGVKTFSKETLRLGNLNCRRKVITENIEYVKSLGLELTKENWERNRYCKNVPCWDKIFLLNKDEFGDLINLFVVNHKIKSIEYIDYPNFIDVYDLTIENKEKTHNFALDAGVVVSNCHVDLASQSTSQAGYSLWHKEYVVNDLGEHQTVFVADFVSWISAPNRIDHDAIKQLSLDLRDKAGVYIKTISYDQFQCFTGDTKVSLLNGEEVSFKDILERFNSGEGLFTYTLDLKTKKVVPGRIINAKNNGKKRIMKVVLDNDEEIRCTLDHRFMLRGGDFIQAQYLNCGDSLMPLYRKSIKVKYIEFLDEYEDVYDISIDKAPNFALSAGVFVHNSEYVRQSLQQHHEFENVRYQSVDRDITAYLNFAQWMITGRIKVGDCPYLREQLGYIGVADKKLVTTHKKDMADSCLAYDTKIFLLSGKVLTIEELYNSDIEHEWVLACDCESKQLKPVKIERVLEKHIPETLLQFTLSNGKTFACTDDHLILMKSGEYKQAEDIAPYDELMPFNYYHELNYHDRYRKVVNPFKGTPKFLYKIVSQNLLSNAIAEAKKRAVIDGSKFTVIHHKSHNKNDDRPENLVPLTNIEHTNLHAMTGREIKAFHDRTVMKRARTKIINEGLALMKQVNPEGYRRYLLKHDLGDKLAEQKSKVENLHVYVTQITKIENTKPVYDIVLNSIHNFALDCNVFVHNCVGAVNNAYLDATPVEFPYIEAKTQEVKAEDSFVYDSKKQEVIEI